MPCSVCGLKNMLLGTCCLSNQATQAIKGNSSNYGDTGSHSPKLLLLPSNNSI